MKNLLLPIAAVLILSACNSSSETKNQPTDSVELSLGSIRDSIKKYPDDQGLKYKLAIILENAGKYKEAVRVLDSINVRKSDSANPKTYFNYLFKRSELLTLSGDTANAIKTLELFVIPGELTEAGLRLTYLYAETKNAKALSFSDSMNKHDAVGHNPNPDYLKGIYYYNVDDYTKALEQFNSCIRKDYTFLDAYMEKGRILYKQSRCKEAIEVYDLAIKVSNTFADAHYWKGKCQEMLGQKAEAKLSYQRAYGFDKTLTEAKEAADRINN